MELHSEAFVAQVRRALDVDLPSLAAVRYRSTEGFVGAVEAREDTETFAVTEATRDGLPARLTERLLACL
jgi:nucleoside-triphosphatase THEP1